jgi:hypothetical protein
MRLSGSLGRGIRLPFDLILTNDKDQTRKLLSETFELLAGQIETSALRKASAVIYSVTEHSQASFQKEDEVIRFLNAQLGRVQIFLSALWLLKDNAVNFELGFLEYPYRDLRRSTVTSNFRAVRFSKADGTFESVEFVDSEARNAREIFQKLFSAEIVDRDEYRGWVVPEDFNRLSRVFYFVQGARSSSDLGNKIARYVTCFEALFCTDSSEMAHKLSERVAFFVGKDSAERINIFRKIKAAYNVRSKVVHGDKISKKLAEQATDLVRTCDELLRNSLTKILTTPGLPKIFSGVPGELEEYLTNMILGQNQAGGSVTNGSC